LALKAQKDFSMILRYLLILFLSQICFVQTNSVSSNVSRDSQKTESIRIDKNGSQPAGDLSEECRELLGEISLKNISYEKFIGYPPSSGLGGGYWATFADICGVSKTVDLLDEYERLHQQLGFRKERWLKLTKAKLFLYNGQQDNALEAFDRALVKPEPTLENSELPDSFYVESGWNHLVRAYIAVTKKEKEKLLEVREQLSKVPPVVGQIPYLQDVDYLIRYFDKFQILRR
jgi:hypothetical protein